MEFAIQTDTHKDLHSRALSSSASGSKDPGLIPVKGDTGDT
jgi:hypothetical protein